MEKEKIKVNALTRSYANISRVITTPIAILNTATKDSIETLGIWDTGATGSAITKTLSEKLKLVPIGQTKVMGVHGIKEGINIYAVTIVLNNQNVSFTLPVTECEKLSDDNSCDFLIGMDVISKGDFAITNQNSKTTMSFRVPSIQRIDFVSGMKNHTPFVSDKLPNRNDACHCGSGKKYKHCHGK